MAEIYLYFPRSPAGMIRGDIEFGLEELMGDRGEIVGGGFGVNASSFNIDLEISSEENSVVDSFVQEMLEYLKSLSCPGGTHIVVRIGDQDAQSIRL